MDIKFYDCVLFGILSKFEFTESYRNTLNMKVLSSFFFLVIVFSVRAQVNTENMRRYNAQNGLTHSVYFQYGLLSGNSDVSNISVGYRADWLSNKYYSFAVANYQRGESNGELNVRKGFVHVRTCRNVTDHWLAEAFFQKEFNDFWRLQNRQLGGLGLRLELANRDSSNRVRRLVAVGSGFMREYEKYLKPLDETVTQWRSTSYLSLLLVISQGISLTSTMYGQIGVQRHSDYRILNESTLSFHIWKNVSFGSTFKYRYDHEPPMGVKRRDLELTNGISISL